MLELGSNPEGANTARRAVVNAQVQGDGAGTKNAGPQIRPLCQVCGESSVLSDGQKRTRVRAMPCLGRA
jgi:hypothetical protein